MLPSVATASQRWNTVPNLRRASSFPANTSLQSCSTPPPQHCHGTSLMCTPALHHPKIPATLHARHGRTANTHVYSGHRGCSVEVVVSVSLFFRPKILRIRSTRQDVTPLVGEGQDQEPDASVTNPAPSCANAPQALQSFGKNYTIVTMRFEERHCLHTYPTSKSSIKNSGPFPESL